MSVDFQPVYEPHLRWNPAGAWPNASQCLRMGSPGFARRSLERAALSRSNLNFAILINEKRSHADLNKKCTQIPESHLHMDAVVANTTVNAVSVPKEACTVKFGCITTREDDKHSVKDFLPSVHAPTRRKWKRPRLLTLPRFKITPTSQYSFEASPALATIAWR